MTRYLLALTLLFILPMNTVWGASILSFARVDDYEIVESVFLDEPTVIKGYTLTSPDEKLKLGILPEAVKGPTRIDIKILDPDIMMDSMPEGKTLLTPVYLFDVLNKEVYDNDKYYWFEMEYDPGLAYLYDKGLYFYNGVSGLWEPLPSTDIQWRHTVRALIHLPYARLAVFGHHEIMNEGIASWYKYKDCDCAASPDYPKGTQLLVKNANDPERSVVVTINDWGPDRSVFPDRIIDLDVTAFDKIGDYRTGTMAVTVEPYEPAVDLASESSTPDILNITVHD